MKRITACAAAAVLWLAASHTVWCQSIGNAKLLANGQVVEIESVVVTAVKPGFFYVEQPDRSAGIRVQSAYTPSVGSSLLVIGTMAANVDGERYVAASFLTEGPGQPVSPVAVSCSELGGGNFGDIETGGQIGVDGGEGLNNVGLLVSISGAFAIVDESTFTIDDGSGAHVWCESPGGRLNSSWLRVRATGICTLEKGRTVRAKLLATDIEVLVNGTYEAPMASVPATCCFQMGNSHDYDDYTAYNNGLALNEPQHTVAMSAYTISEHEVTRGEYLLFMLSGGYANPALWSADGWTWKTSVNRTKPDMWDPFQNWGTGPQFTQTSDHPVIGVTYYEAEAFSHWAGGELPTEAQWEYAARGASGQIYPWHDFWDLYRCNSFSDPYFPGFVTAPVGSFSGGESFAGCLDMAGHVQEWCRDWYADDYGPWVADPAGPASGTQRVLKGSWFAATNYASYYPFRCAARRGAPADAEGFATGFRVVK